MKLSEKSELLRQAELAGCAFGLYLYDKPNADFIYNNLVGLANESTPFENSAYEAFTGWQPDKGTNSSLSLSLSLKPR